jgi:DNA-binding NarL/FixJ family response regulator
MNLSTNDQNNPPRVVLVDDHPALLRQTAHLLSGRFEIVATLPNGRDLIDIAAKENVDVVVMDITLPGLSGIELAAKLKKSGFAGRIVFLTVHADPDYAREALEVGGFGYVVKPRLASDLIPAIKAALEGTVFISPCPELKAIA